MEESILNKPELYRLIFQSRKSAVKKFERGIFHNVFEKIVCDAVIKSMQKYRQGQCRYNLL